VGAVQDLSFIHYAHITMSDGSTGSTTPPVEIVDYERPANYVASPVITAPTTCPHQCVAGVGGQEGRHHHGLAGMFPEAGWSADVTLHMSGKISYKF
jgi:hypothetical protein